MVLLVFLQLALNFQRVVSAQGYAPPKLRCETSLIAFEDSFGVYVKELVQEKLLGIEELNTLAQALQKRQILNPLNSPELSTSSAKIVHFEGLKRLIEIKPEKIDWDKLSSLIAKEIESFREVSGERIETIRETKSTLKKMKFNPVVIGDKSIALRDFEMMDTSVTQWQWAMLTGKAPSYVARKEGILTAIRGTEFKLMPDHPVTAITFTDAEEAAEALNYLSEQNDPLIYEIIPDHKPGSMYRLPKIEEYYFLVSGGKTIKHTFPFKDDEPALLCHAWIKLNSNAQTHPVAEKASFVSQGQEYFDLYGNVWEWAIADTVDARKQMMNTDQILFGGCYANSFLDFNNRGLVQSKNRTFNVYSVRFVRVMAK